MFDIFVTPLTKICVCVCVWVLSFEVWSSTSPPPSVLL